MPLCAPTCADPSCESLPSVGFGGFSSFGSGLGYGCGSGLQYGYGSGLGGSIGPAAALGVLSGVNPSCINQIPPSGVTIQPPSFNVTVPGAILSATCEPIRVGGYASCAPGGSALGGYGGYGGYGGFGGFGGQGGLLGGGVCSRVGSLKGLGLCQ